MDGTNGKVDITEEKISEFESIAVETTQNETYKQRKENFKKWTKHQ